MIELKEYLENYKVLIAEDDDLIRTKITNILEFYFKKVYQCDNGFLAYDIFLKEKPDLIITDIEMKNGNGINLVKNIKAINIDTPIIVLSAYSKEEYLLELINQKIDHYILKPATNKKLFEAISNALLNDKKNKYEIYPSMFLDINKGIIIYKEEKIHLRKKEKYFLELLYKNKDKITNYDLIQEYIWVDKVMTQNALKTFVKELRQKLPIQIIENIMQEGYKLSKFN